MSALRDAIVQHLQADANVAALVTGGVHPGIPTGVVTFPFVTVTAQRAPTMERVFQGIAFEDATYLVKAIDRSTSSRTVGEITAAIRTALDLASLTINNYTSMGIACLGEVQYDELTDGITYQHEGGIYSLMAEPT